MAIVEVSADDLRKQVKMTEAIHAVREAFVDFGHDGFEMPTRVVLGDGKFLVMSVHHPDSRSAVVKTVSINFERLPAIAGTVVWSELNRSIHLVADAGSVTTLRTGAVVGVATHLMAPPDAGDLVLIGAGGQGADQVRAVHAVRPLRSLYIVDLNLERAEALAVKLRPDLGSAVLRVHADADSVVGEADIICCATTATEPLFEASSLSERVHVNAIGAFRPSMRELPAELLADSSIVVDELAAVLIEAGDIMHAVRTGVLSEDQLVELGSALVDPPVFRPRTVFKSVGVAIQDWALARLLAEKMLR